MNFTSEHCKDYECVNKYTQENEGGGTLFILLRQTINC